MIWSLSPMPNDVQTTGSDFAKQVESGAKALAWSKLTDYGRQTCDWIRDFSDAERAQYRAKAIIVLQAAGITNDH
jgi:hypothetical protein